MHFVENYPDFWHNKAIFAYKMQKKQNKKQNKKYKFVSLIHKERKSDEYFPSSLPFILLSSFHLLWIRHFRYVVFYLSFYIIWCFELKLSAN